MRRKSQGANSCFQETLQSSEEMRVGARVLENDSPVASGVRFGDDIWTLRDPSNPRHVLMSDAECTLYWQEIAARIPSGFLDPLRSFAFVLVKNGRLIKAKEDPSPATVVGKILALCRLFEKLNMVHGVKSPREMTIDHLREVVPLCGAHDTLKIALSALLMPAFRGYLTEPFRVVVSELSRINWKKYTDSYSPFSSSIFFYFLTRRTKISLGFSIILARSR